MLALWALTPAGGELVVVSDGMGLAASKGSVGEVTGMTSVSLRSMLVVSWGSCLCSVFA